MGLTLSLLRIVLRIIIFFGDNFSIFYTYILGGEREPDREREEKKRTETIPALRALFTSRLKKVHTHKHNTRSGFSLERFVCVLSEPVSSEIFTHASCSALHTSICQGNFYLISSSTSAKTFYAFLRRISFFSSSFSCFFDPAENAMYCKSSNGTKFHFVGMLKMRCGFMHGSRERMKINKKYIYMLLMGPPSGRKTHTLQIIWQSIKCDWIIKAKRVCLRSRARACVCILITARRWLRVVINLIIIFWRWI